MHFPFPLDSAFGDVLGAENAPPTVIDLGDGEEPLQLYFGDATDFIPSDRYEEFSDWLGEMAEETCVLDNPDDAQVAGAWVQTDRWGDDGEHLYWSCVAPAKTDGDGLFGQRSVAEVVVTTKPPLPGKSAKRFEVCDREMTEDGWPRFLALTADTIHYYEVWLGKTLLWRSDYGQHENEDDDEVYRKQDREIVTWLAETRKEYLESVGASSPWKLLKREVDRGCLVDAESPAHPDREAEADEAFCKWVEEADFGPDADLD